MGSPSKQPTLLPTADALCDAELVERSLNGDRWSRDMLYRRHAHYLLAIASRLLSSRGEGEEVVQDTFVVGLDQLGTLRDPAAVRGWLAQIAVSLVRRRLRRGRLLRLLGLSALISICSIGATAWLAVRTTTGAIQQEQGRALTDDAQVYDALLGYAATHPDWSDVGDTVRQLALRTGRRITLTTEQRTPVADSATKVTPAAIPPAAPGAGAHRRCPHVGRVHCGRWHLRRVDQWSRKPPESRLHWHVGREPVRPG